jgi:hypothetical protein
LNPDPTKSVKWGDRATDEMMDGYLNYITVHEDLNIDVKNGRVLPISETGVVPASRANQTSTAAARTAGNHGPQAPATAEVKPLAPVKPPAAAVKPSPASVEPRAPVAVEARSTTAGARDEVSRAEKSAADNFAADNLAADNLAADNLAADNLAADNLHDNLDKAAKRRNLIAAGGIALLVLFGGLGGYSLGRRNRSKQVAERVGACPDLNTVPVESPAGAAFRVTTDR